jgi:hypothetical protein
MAKKARRGVLRFQSWLWSSVLGALGLFAAGCPCPCHPVVEYGPVVMYGPIVPLYGVRSAAISTQQPDAMARSVTPKPAEAKVADGSERAPVSPNPLP